MGTGTKALPEVYDAETERCRQKTMQKQLQRKLKAAAAEDRWERTQVLQLEEWERSHVPRRSAHLAAASSAVMLGASAATRKPQQSKSESALQRSASQTR